MTIKNNKSKATMTFLLLISFSFLSLSCAKKRQDKISDDFSTNLLEVINYQGKNFELTTDSKLITQTQVSSATTEKVEKSGDLFGQLKYTTNSPLLKEDVVIGRPKTKYKVQYKLTEKYLIINKLAHSKDISPEELSYASAPNKDQVRSVPLVGYPALLYKFVNSINSNGEKTHNLRPEQVFSVTEATHFKIDILNPKSFSSHKKRNIFKSNLLEGEWFYASTIVSTSPKKASTIGVTEDLTSSVPASRLRFDKLEDALLGVDLNVDENIDKSKTINLRNLIKIPAKWIDFLRQAKIGDALQETKLDDQHSKSRHFKLREFVQLTFTGVESKFSKGLNRNAAVLEQFTSAKDFLSFTIHYIDDKMKIMYAFKKAHAPLKGRVYNAKDMQTYGFFDTKVNYIRNHRYEREKDFTQLTFLNKFYPKDNKITYYFSRMTPEHMKGAGRRAIKAWNQTFKDAETGITLTLNEEKTVNIGDIRYNILNIVDTKNGSRSVGLGPSTVDSKSGEIISATTNIYVNPMREGLIRAIRNYIRFEIGLFKKTEITEIQKSTNIAAPIAFSNGSSTNTKELIKSTERLLKELPLPLLKDQESLLTRALNQKIAIQKNNLKLIKNQAIIDDYGFGHYQNFLTTTKDTINNIKEECMKEGSSLSIYIKKLKNNKLNVAEGEVKILNDCADKLLEDQVVVTMIHELGHNFGLRHNFAGSTDPKNFPKGGTTSSMMDYQANNINGLHVPGPYDLEAIRFAYANKVTTTDGSILLLKNPELSIDENLKNLSIKKKKKVFAYCTDRDVQRFDPLCNRHDHGTNPEEIVDSTISRFNTIYSLYGHRHDRNNGANPRGFTNFVALEDTLLPLKRIYDQWRFHLSEFTSDRYRYLEEYSEKDFKRVIKEMSTSKGPDNRPDTHAKNYAKYYKASTKIYEFLKTLITLPSKHCLAKENSLLERVEELQTIFDFEELREEIYKEKGISISGCNSPEAVAKLRDKGYLPYALTRKKEELPDSSFGYNFNNQRGSLNIKDTNYEKIDIVGLKQVKIYAMEILALRAPSMLHLRVNNYRPNFMDNPIYREEIGNLIIDRIVNGINPNNTKIASMKNYSFPLFRREKSQWLDAIREFFTSLNIPDKREVSIARLTPFMSIKTSDPRRIEKGAPVTKFANTLITANPQNNPVASAFITKREELKKDQEMSNAGVYIPSKKEARQVLNKIMKDPSLPIVRKQELLSKEFTFSKFISKLEALHTIITNIKTPGLKPDMIKFFDIEINLLRVLKENEKGLARLLNAPVHKVLEGPLKGLLSQLDISTTYFSMQNVLMQRVTSFIKNKNIKKYRAKHFHDNRDEYEAQLDMITEILLMI